MKRTLSLLISGNAALAGCGDRCRDVRFSTQQVKAGFMAHRTTPGNVRTSFASQCFYIGLKTALVAMALLSLHCPLQGQEPSDLKVRHRAGSAHGFLVLRDQAGVILASGDLTQIPNGDRIRLRVAFHFRDGSFHEETTVYSQRPGLRLISDHLVQRGKSFPNPCDITIDTRGQQVNIRALSNGKEVVKTEHMDLPDDLTNGIALVLVENLQPGDPKIEVPYLALSAKPRMVKLAIAPEGEEQFNVSGRRYKATKYDIRINLGGVAGVVAPMIGKQPADTHVWVNGGNAPTIVRVDGALYPEGPAWSIQLASPVW